MSAHQLSSVLGLRDTWRSRAARRGYAVLVIATLAIAGVTAPAAAAPASALPGPAVRVTPAVQEAAAAPVTQTGVSADALPTAQIDGVVWSQAVVGNRVFAGGDFDTIRPAGSAAGVNAAARVAQS